MFNIYFMDKNTANTFRKWLYENYNIASDFDNNDAITFCFTIRWCNDPKYTDYPPTFTKITSEQKLEIKEKVKSTFGEEYDIVDYVISEGCPDDNYFNAQIRRKGTDKSFVNLISLWGAK